MRIRDESENFGANSCIMKLRIKKYEGLFIKGLEIICQES